MIKKVVYCNCVDYMAQVRAANKSSSNLAS